MWLTLASIFMLFAGLVAAYAFALDKQKGWHPVHMPPQLWASTAALGISSMLFQAARYALRRGKLPRYRKLLNATIATAALFFLFQTWAWRDLSAQGVYMKGNPHGSMWFAFTGFHAAHAAGGLLAMFLLLPGARRLRAEDGEPPLRRHRNLAMVTAMYWHFMGVLWVALFGLLHMWNQL